MTLPARRTTLKHAAPPPAGADAASSIASQPTPSPTGAADIPIGQRIPIHACDTWRSQLGDALTASGTKQDAFGAVIGKPQSHVSAMVTGGDPTRKLTMDHVEFMRDSAVTHDAWLEFMKSHVGPGYVIERAPTTAFELCPAKVISIARITNDFERSLLAWPSNQGPRQMSFLLSGGELVLRGVGELVYSMRQKRRRGRP